MFRTFHEPFWMTEQSDSRIKVKVSFLLQSMTVVELRCRHERFNETRELRKRKASWDDTRLRVHIVPELCCEWFDWSYLSSAILSPFTTLAKRNLCVCNHTINDLPESESKPWSEKIRLVWCHPRQTRWYYVVRTKSLKIGSFAETSSKISTELLVDHSRT